MQKVTPKKQNSITSIDITRKSCPRESIKPLIAENEFATIKHELMILKRDVKTEREANRSLFKKLLDAKSEAETLKKALASYRKRYYDEKEKCHQLYAENTNQRMQLLQLTGAVKSKDDGLINRSMDKRSYEAYRTKYENEKKRNEALTSVIKQLESSKGDSSTTLSGTKQKIGSTMGSNKVISRLPSISREQLLMPGHNREIHTKLEYDLFSEYQSNAPNEIHNFTFKQKEVAKVQPLLVKARTII